MQANLQTIDNQFTSVGLSTANSIIASLSASTAALAAGGATTYISITGGAITHTLSVTSITVNGLFLDTSGIFTATGPYFTIAPNARGSGSNDLLLGKTDAADVPSGTWSILLGGYHNQAAGDFCPVVAGRGNICSSEYSGVVSGYLNNASGEASFIGAGQSNNSGVTGGAYSGIVGGISNRCQGSYCFVGGGDTNFNLGSYGSMVGGSNNRCATSASANYCAVGGGSANDVEAFYATIPGGSANTANGAYCQVGGGNNNACNGVSAVVPGGSSNTATGDYSFAMGLRANAGARGTFVWADATSTSTTLTSSTSNQFLVRANGGILLQTSSMTMTGNAYLGTGLGITTITASGFLIAPAWTLARIQAYTPAATELWGQVTCTNCSSAGSVCQSTGTVLGGFRLGLTGTTGCQ